MLIRLTILWIKSCWRSAVSWAGLALCSLRAMGPLPDLAHCRSIRVVQLGHFGDMILTLPLLDAIKKSNKKTHLRVITTPAGAAVARAFGSQDEILIPEDRKGNDTNLDGSDLIIHLRGGLGWVIGAFRRRHAGFVHGLPHRSALRWAPLVLMGIPLNRRVPEHQYATLVRRMRQLGVSMPQRPHLDVEPQAISGNLPLDAGYVVVHAGGNWKPRRWSEENFSQICARLWQAYGLRTLLIAAHETPELCERLRIKGIPFHALDLSCTVHNLAGMIKGAVLYLGNDSGPAHLAGALGIPCVILYGPQDPRLFGVLSEKYEALKGRTYCSPCWQVNCPFNQVRCMENISIDSVIAAINRCEIAS